MAKNEKTSKRIASIAGRILAVKRADVCVLDMTRGVLVHIKWSDIRALAASALTQAPDKKKRTAKNPRRK